MCLSFIVNIVLIYRVSVRVKVSITRKNTIIMVAFYSILVMVIGRCLLSVCFIILVSLLVQREM